MSRGDACVFLWGRSCYRSYQPIDGIWLMSHFMPAFFFCIHRSSKPFAKMKLHNPRSFFVDVPINHEHPLQPSLFCRLWKIFTPVCDLFRREQLRHRSTHGFIHVHTFGCFRLSNRHSFKAWVPLLAHKASASCWISRWKDVNIKKKSFQYISLHFLPFWTLNNNVSYFLLYRDSWQRRWCLCETLSRKKVACLVKKESCPPTFLLSHRTSPQLMVVINTMLGRFVSSKIQDSPQDESGINGS